MQSLPNKNTSLFRRFLTPILLIGWFVGIGLLLANFQSISDWFKLRDYRAPAAVAELATQDTMTDYGRKLFYVNHPNLVQKADFSGKCPENGTSGGEQTIVLGCYHPDGSGIFLLAVTDSRLEGVQQVTAAHEMLHAVYDRLNKAERDKVNSMLQDYYSHVTDQHIRDVMAAYQKSEPQDVVNEMHSVFGSEIANLPAPLEQYYQRYFTNRTQVATYAAQYQGEFTSRQQIIASDDAQLASLKDQIDAMEADLKSQESAIKAQRTELDALRDSNATAYNAAVPRYNESVDAYNGEIEQVKGLIEQFNQLVVARNAVAFEEDQLTKALSASSTPIPNN